jgi:hypothetical protein
MRWEYIVSRLQLSLNRIAETVAMRTNLDGVLLCAMNAASLLERSDHAAIVNIASIMRLFGTRGSVPTSQRRQV